jgi:hypothetical protein
MDGNAVDPSLDQPLTPCLAHIWKSRKLFLTTWNTSKATMTQSGRGRTNCFVRERRPSFYIFNDATHLLQEHSSFSKQVLGSWTGASGGDGVAGDDEFIGRHTVHEIDIFASLDTMNANSK